MDIKTCAYLLSQAVHIDHAQPHVYEDYNFQKPYNYAKSAASIPVGLALMGRYDIVYPGLDDGEMVILRTTADGKLMVDASVAVVVSGGFTHKYYGELTVNNIDTVLNFGFSAQEVSIFNDGLFTVHYEFGVIPMVGTSPRLYAGEAYTDNFVSDNIHIITLDAGETSAVRVWARG